MKFSIKDFFIKCEQIRRNCGPGHIYWKNPERKTSIFVQWMVAKPIFKTRNVNDLCMYIMLSFF